MAEPDELRSYFNRGLQVPDEVISFDGKRPKLVPSRLARIALVTVAVSAGAPGSGFAYNRLTNTGSHSETNLIISKLEFRH